MALPKLIPIRYLSDYRTDTIGTYSHGYFFGLVYFALPNQQLLVSVLHLFDQLGNHQSTTGWERSETTDPEAELKAAVAALPFSEMGDIHIRLFETEVFGQTVGLIEAAIDHAEYVPNGFGFFPPWDGLYDT